MSGISTISSTLTDEMKALATGKNFMKHLFISTFLNKNKVAKSRWDFETENQTFSTNIHNEKSMYTAFIKQLNNSHSNLGNAWNAMICALIK